MNITPIAPFLVLERNTTDSREKLDMKQQFYIDISTQLINTNSFTKNLFQVTNDGPKR